MRRSLKLMYLAGTQDPHRALRFMHTGEDDPDALFVPYVRQFLELCDSITAEGIVFSTRGPRDKKTTGRFTFYNAPNPMRSAKGLLYDVGQILYGLLVFTACLVHRPRVVFVGDGIMHYITIPLLRLSGAKVVLTFHNTLWTCFSEKPDRWRRIAKTCRSVFTNHVAAIMSASATISDNFAEATNGRCRPLLEFLPTYHPSTFNGIAESSPQGVFHIVCVGRIMPEKGAFDMVQIVSALRDEGCHDISVTMCGEGNSEAALVKAITQSNLGSILRFHGQCDAAEILKMYASANLIVAPTRTDFREGFNQVVAEAVLAGRPVVTSQVCPAVRHLDAGVVLAEPDNVDSYVRALRTQYQRRGQPNRPTLSEAVRARFFDPEYGWIETARRAMNYAIGGNPRASKPAIYLRPGSDPLERPDAGLGP